MVLDLFRIEKYKNNTFYKKCRLGLSTESFSALFPFRELKASEQFNSFLEIEQQIKIKHGLIV